MTKKRNPCTEMVAGTALESASIAVSRYRYSSECCKDKFAYQAGKVDSLLNQCQAEADTITTTPVACMIAYRESEWLQKQVIQCHFDDIRRSQRNANLVALVTSEL